MHKLKNRWWKERGAKNCKALRNAPKGASPLKARHQTWNYSYIDLRSFYSNRFVCLFLSIWLVIDSHNLLQVDNVAGAFLVLMIGMGLSVVTAVVEFFWVSRSALANQNVRYVLWQTPNTAKIHTSPNCQFPSKIKRSSPDWQSEPFTEWSDVKLWSKRQKGSVHASRFLSQTTAIFATCVYWKLN